MSKYGHRTHNWFEAIINKIGGEKAAERFLRGELTIVESIRSWTEKDGVIYFSVISNGLTGPEWIAHFEKKGDHVSDPAKQIICSSDFVPTQGVTYQVAVLKGVLFNDKNRVIRKIRTEAANRQLVKSHAEIGCLIRDKFTDTEIEAMGLIWITTMHEPIKDSDGDPDLLLVYRNDDGRWLGAYCDDPEDQWGSGDGFAFVVSQGAQS